MKIVFLSAVDDLDHAVKAVNLRVHGYVMKGITGTELTKVIGSIHTGEKFLTPDLAWRLLTLAKASQAELQKKTALLPNLSNKERQIFKYVMRGLTSIEIADLMGLKNGTIRNYTTLVFRKLGVRNRLEAIEHFGRRTALR